MKSVFEKRIVPTKSRTEPRRRNGFMSDRIYKNFGIELLLTTNPLLLRLHLKIQLTDNN